MSKEWIQAGQSIYFEFKDDIKDLKKQGRQYKRKIAALRESLVTLALSCDEITPQLDELDRVLYEEIDDIPGDNNLSTFEGIRALEPTSFLGKLYKCNRSCDLFLEHINERVPNP